MPDDVGDIADRYRAVLFDLDGTLIRGRAALSGAPEVIAELRRQRVSIGYVTNNASRGPQGVAVMLREAGFPAVAEDICTSAQAAADLLARRFPAGTRVLVVGTDDLRAEVAEVGMTAVTSADQAPAAVVQGFSPELEWSMLAEACIAIRAGAWWVATNRDLTLPGPRGLVPGNGSLVAALSAATGQVPVFAGKPELALFQRAARIAGQGPALVVGDRLDTDIAGAARAGMDTAVVLTGVSRPMDVLTAERAQRPRWIAADVNDLLQPLDTLAAAASGGWRVNCPSDGSIVLHSAGPTAGDAARTGAVDALRSLCARWWPRGEQAPAEIRAGDPAAAAALSALGLDRRSPSRGPRG